MRFLASPGAAAQQRARPPVLVFLGFTVVLVAALGLQRALHGEWTPGGVRELYLGSGEPGEAMPLLALLEGLHVGAFLYGFVWLMLGSLLVVSPMRPGVKQALMWSGPAAAVLDLASPFLVVWLEGAAAVRVASGMLGLGLVLVTTGTVGLKFGRERGA